MEKKYIFTQNESSFEAKGLDQILHADFRVLK